MKTLNFRFRDEPYQVNEMGHIKANGSGDFSDTWIFAGGSPHHWHNHIVISLVDAFDRPELLNGYLGWDFDHGSLRQWSGCFGGKLPRITGAYVN